MTNTPPKFPRTYHLPFSPGLQNDDRLHQSPDRFLGRTVICTEKLDGGSTCIYNGCVYARSIGQEAKHPSFDYIKANHVPRTIGIADDLYLYGENLYAKHSIGYNALPDYFFLFAVSDGKIWYSWQDVELVAEACGFQTPPVIFSGYVYSFSEIQNVARMNNSFFGGDCEGFVIRDSEQFAFKEYSNRAAKYVRDGHIQTDEHWSKNWIPNSLYKSNS